MIAWSDNRFARLWDRMHSWRWWLAVLMAGISTAQAETPPIRHVINQYALTSANDFAERDPQDWRLLGSNDGGQTWTTLDARTNQVFETRGQRRLYTANNLEGYNVYRLQIDRVVNPEAASSVHLAELELMGVVESDHSPTPQFSDLITARGDNPPAERVENLFDHHPNTKWLDWAPDAPTRASWIQWQYLAPKEAAAIQAKVIHQYALTSANDFPQRDPQDWTLLGSNDGGATWTTLDARTNQIFEARQQRKLYNLEKARAFNMYRLRIDGLRNPAAAPSVQLAELELMGLNEGDHSPTPLFTDIVSAQGDNPPAEKVENLFDGRVETKWLDWLPNAHASWIQWQYVIPPKAAITRLGQLQNLPPHAGSGLPVKIAAMVVGGPLHGNKICLIDATGCMELGDVSGDGIFDSGQKVLVTGITQWSDSQIGVREGHVEPDGSAPATQPEHILPGQPMTSGENLKWVEVDGEIEDRHPAGSDSSFDLLDGTTSLRVHLVGGGNMQALPPAGTRVSIRGICRGAFDEQGVWVPGSLWAAGAGSIMVRDSRNDSREIAAHSRTPADLAPSPALLTTVEQIRWLTADQLAVHPRVKIRGVITDELEGFVQDATGGIQAAFNTAERRKITSVGDRVELEGSASLTEVGSPEIAVDHLTVLGQGRLPKPQKFSLGLFSGGRIDAQWIEVDGVVRSTDGSHLLIIAYGQELMAAITKAPVDTVNSLVDAEIRACGVAVTARDDQGRVQGIHLLVPSLDCVDIIKAPPDTKLLPVRKIGTLSGLSGPARSFHLVKVEGVVTLQQGRMVFFQDETGSAMAALKEDVTLDSRFGRSRWLYWQAPQPSAYSNSTQIFRAGERVEAIGFAEAYRYSPVLAEATLFRLGGQEQLNPVPLTPDRLAAGGLDSCLVTFDGILHGQTPMGNNFILEVEWENRTLQVVVPRKESTPLDIQPGSLVRVTGICQIDPPPYPELGQAVAAVRVLTHTAADLTVLSRPSWWTLRHALMLMGAMTLVIAVGLIWLHALHSQVAERTAQLSKEIQLRERAESRHALEHERARIAEDLHDDLGANLAQIIFLSERVKVAQNDGPERARWFNRIPITARRTIQSLDEIVWAINPQNDSLESLANYLGQFAQEHLALANVRCVLDIPTVLSSVPLSTDIRHNLLLTTRESLQNIVMHARATEVHITLRFDEEHLFISIADNGRGFDPAAESPDGNGLRNMRQRLNSIGGRLEINSRPGHGTTISLIVPKKMLYGHSAGEPQGLKLKS